MINPDDLAINHGLLLIGQRFNLDELVYERPVCIYNASNFVNCRLGAFTYLGTNADCKNVTVGRYCSIAGNLLASLGSHSMQWFTTFPFTASINPFSFFTSNETLEHEWTECKIPYDYQPKQISLANDIWIGHNVLFTSAKEITVGNGAIIGANAVVTRDVPAYCIAAGNPARIVRQRFSDAIIADLLATEWWNYDLPACFAAHKGLIDSKFVRDPQFFLHWWKNGGKELIQKFPLSHEWRKISMNNSGVEISFLGNFPASSHP